MWYNITMGRKKYKYEYKKFCEICNKLFITTKFETKTCSRECSTTLSSAGKIKYTLEQKSQAIELRKRGITLPVISKDVNVKVSTLEKWFREEGIVLSKEQYKINTLGARWKNYEPTSAGKICSYCKIYKNESEFQEDKRSLTGLSSKCSDCHGMYYEKDPEKYKLRAKKWFKENPQKRKKAKRNYYNNNANKINACNLKWKLNNPEKTRKYARDYKSRNRQEMIYASAMYRAIKLRATPKWLSDEQKAEIFNIYKMCPKTHHVDHIVPLKGEMVSGLHVPWNLTIIPKSINLAKSNKPSADMSVADMCHQYKIRLATIEEDIKNGCPLNTHAREYMLQYELFTPEHRAFIEKYEWLRTIGFAPKWVFTARYGSILGGVVLISEPNSYLNFNMEKEALISRGACASWTPKNLGSRLIMFACKWMVENTPKRLFTGYSDPLAGEIGTIYQACNFEYLGPFYGAEYVYTLPSGKKVNARFFTRTTSLKKWAKELGIEWLPEWLKPNGFINTNSTPRDTLTALRRYGRDFMLSLPCEHIPPKGKYALLLWKNKKEKQELLAMKKWQSLPYPKRKAKESIDNESSSDALPNTP